MTKQVETKKMSDKTERMSYLMQSEWLYTKVTEMPGMLSSETKHQWKSKYMTTEEANRLEYDLKRERLFTGEEYGFLRQTQEAELEEAKQLLSDRGVYDLVFLKLNGRFPSDKEKDVFEGYNHSFRRQLIEARASKAKDCLALKYKGELVRIEELLRSQKIYNYVLALIGTPRTVDENFMGYPGHFCTEKELKRRQFDVVRSNKCMGDDKKMRSLHQLEQSELNEMKVLLNNRFLLWSTLSKIILEDNLMPSQGYMNLALENLGKEPMMCLRTRRILDRAGAVLHHRSAHEIA